ncbi:SIS domain-containing protein [Pseudoxanthomonas yeongjuensis]|uniref:SIS domain-containing protein n=1 Tax=Pseudoxanthomonas yeongjuensis TaxID=377616 RepID=UPI001FE6D089|nr:SIS domain-containing protein [Pseudoxanthomonas yeongjuensis]
MTNKTVEHLGIPEPDLLASGAIWTAREIEQQPRMLEQTHALLSGLREQVEAFVAPVAGDANARIILTGAGSSSYIGQCLAPLLDRNLAARVDSVPTTDLVSAPYLYLDPAQPLLLVSFGRSGNSPESLAAVALAESLVKDVRHLVVTCNAEGALNTVPARRMMALLLPEETHDTSFAMTSSFSCMLYATLLALGDTQAMDARIGPIAHATARVIDGARLSLQELALHGFDRVVYLGSGLFQGLAREAALKLGELTNGSVATCFDSPLGFRHGPKTFITDRTLVMVFVSNDPLTRRYDHDLIDELRQDGCAARIIEVAAQQRQQQDPDTLLVPGMAEAADIDLLWPYVAIAQIYAFNASRALGLSPDNPNKQGTVNRVVQGVRIHSAAP